MTSTLKNSVQKHVVTYGNYGFASAAGNPPLFTLSGGRINYNVNPGQLVAYVIEDGVTRIVSASTLDSSEIYELYIGVGIDETGLGITTDVRHIGVEDISGCLPRKASTSSPRCGSPQVVDLYFDCTKCNETYSVEVTVDDNQTQSFGPWNKSYQQFVGSIVTDCSSCDECEVEHNCREVACKLADALNSDLDLKIGSRQYPDWKGKGLPRPYFATRLHASSKIYCFSPQTEAEGCTSCTYVAAVKGAVINGTTYLFTGNLNPTNSAQTLTAQLDHISHQINQAFKTEYGENAHAGSSFTTGSYSNCCSIQLHINSCDTNFSLINAADAAITPQTSNNPFTTYGTVTPVPGCVDCADLEVTPVVYPCGIRIIAERIAPKCGFYIDKPLSFYGRKVTVGPIGDGWKGKPWRVVEVQAMELPAGFGSSIQWLEYQTEPDGRGRRYSRSNKHSGTFNLPDAKSRVNAVTAKCDTNYCSYYLKSEIEKRYLDGTPGFLTVHSNVHIPAADSVTVAAWEAFEEALLALNPACKVVTSVACDTNLGVCA